jgi:hypothetical protein
MLLTVIIVISGILGRYIYTAVPRTADGVEIEAAELEERISSIEVELNKWIVSQPEISLNLTRTLREEHLESEGSVISVFSRAFAETGHRLDFWLARRKLKSQYRIKAVELGNLLKRKRMLQRQVSSLVMARRILSLWHAIHIPIGAALFAASFVHMIGAIYYATLLY